MKTPLARALALVMILSATAGRANAIAAGTEDQAAAVRGLLEFAEVAGPRLFDGHDEKGHCRVFIYPQDGSSKIWIEGTFQRPTTELPTQGIVIPFLLASDAAETAMDRFERTENSITAQATYRAQDGIVTIAVRLEKEDGRLARIAFDSAHGLRACEGLRRVL